MDEKLKHIRLRTKIGNNLDNYIKIGVIFITGWPGLSAPSPATFDNDGWRWFEPSYQRLENISPLIWGLMVLTTRSYLKLTYKVFDHLPGVAVVRIYALPQDSKHYQILQMYENLYLKVKVSEKFYTTIMENLLGCLDFSVEAFALTSAKELQLYIMSHSIALLNCFSLEKLKKVTNEEKRFHISRMINSAPFKQFGSAQVVEGSVLSRLTDVYSRVCSPKANLDDENLVAIQDLIKNDEIQGLKSNLYNFQKRSLLKMIERESIPTEQLMPNISLVRRNHEHFYLNNDNLFLMKSPSYYQPPRGGILAENMGLGKTCICLALICISKFEISEIPFQLQNINKSKIGGKTVDSLVDVCISTISQNSIPWKEYHDDFPLNICMKLENKLGYFEKKDDYNCSRRTRLAIAKENDLSIYKKFYFSSTTLVVLPDNLFHQWKVEIFKHVEKDFLTVQEIQTTDQMKIIQSSSINSLLKNDVVLIATSVFSRQFETRNSIIRSIYWKRLIIDEGHSMNSKSSRAVLLTHDLMYERMWIVSGTPTSGLTNLHVENELQEYTIQKAFDPRQDLIKLGLLVSNFFKIEPWQSSKQLWSEMIIKPFERGDYDIQSRFLSFLETLLIRHNIKDVEHDITLPPLYHKPVLLKPSFYDKLIINLFISVLAANAITSERKGVDYMFDTSNKVNLKRLVTNLQKGAFYWTGFSITDVENLLNICVYSLREKSTKYSTADQHTLNIAIFNSKLALSNKLWRSVTTVHEMGYFVDGLPKEIVENYSLATYRDNISVYGFVHLNNIQRYYYKNRATNFTDNTREQISETAGLFWKNYWKNLKNSKGRSSHSKNNLNIKEELKDFELSDVQSISQTPSWVHDFNPSLEEELLYGKVEPNASLKNKSPNQDVLEKGVKNKGNTVGSIFKNANIIGTLSSKLNYLTIRLLENQMKGIKSIVFYEFENSAYYLTEFMDLLGMNYLLYSSSMRVGDRTNNLAQFDRWDVTKHNNNGISLIMDLKLASHGLTIIAATHVFFINPVWNQSIEAQAIKRSHRIGQMHEVFVETLILENTLEEEMYTMRNETKDSTNVDLIDHEQIKNYILSFPFLKMYTGQSVIQEYCDFKVPYVGSEDNMELNTAQVREGNECAKNSGQGDNVKNDSDGMVLRDARSKYDASDRSWVWELPLFTNSNLDKIANSENKSIKRRYDDIRELEREESMRKVEDTDIGNPRVSQLIEKIRAKRKCRRNVRFNL